MKRLIFLAALLFAIAGSAHAQMAGGSMNGNVYMNGNGIYGAGALAAKTSGGTVQIGQNTVATIGTTCTATQEGQMYMVTDATAGSEGATCAGSGTAVQLAVCNGTNWKCF